jgi:hypothetical protein
MLPSRNLALNVVIALAIAASLGMPATASGEDAATVKGTVTVRGKPLATGRIFFYAGNDQFVGAKIKDGKYTVNNVPGGRRSVSIEGDGVDKRYTSEDKTPLRVEIAKGYLTVDIELRE